MASVSELVGRLRKALKRPRRYPVLYNVNRADETVLHKRALLAYLVQPFLLPDGAPEFRNHQNLQRCKQIAALLGERGYIVDVADVRDRRFKPKRDYDVVLRDRIRMGNFELAGSGTKKLLLATTINHAVHNRNLRRRYELLTQRRGRKLKPRRFFAEQMRYATEAEAIIGIGNEDSLKTWREISTAEAYAVNNFGYADTQFVFEPKSFSAARKNFLFFASGSQVLKGLDLLLEIFPHLPDLSLYVCSSFKHEPDFCVCYHKELFETPNIHPIGRIIVNGPQFYELVRACGYVISTSCSEGQSGAVVQCMYAGLIPVVTRETGIDTEDFGITFADDSLEEIERVIVYLAGLPESWHRERSLKTRQAAEEKYSEAAFMTRWREILAEVLPGV